MTLLDAIILGAVQGATEFLPISSSGHLVLGNELLDLDDSSLLFDIVLHVGTLVAVMGYYRRDIWAVIRDLYLGISRGVSQRSLDAFLEGEGSRLAVLVVLASIPTALLGLGLENILDPEGGERVVTATVVCGILLVNGCMLFTNRWLMDREAHDRKGRWTLWGVTPLVALGIGLIQGIAVLPGVSRSGATITLALFLGVSRTEAARFSFLLSIPAIFGALLLKFDPAVFANGSSEVLTYAAGAVAAALVGLVCLVWLVKLLRDARFHHFAWYCWAIGLLGILLL
jgi:undecaprenyl-diphosphatase